MKRIIIAGSREFNDYELLKRKMDEYLEGQDPYDLEIISGTAQGADQLGERYASEHRIMLHYFPADWRKYGKAAGPIRNEQMAKYAAEKQGYLFAFWNGTSRGTKNMIDLGHQYGLDVHVIGGL